MNTFYLNTLACAVCFGDPNDAQSKGLFFGILALLGILAIVLISFGKFFLTLRQRSGDHS